MRIRSRKLLFNHHPFTAGRGASLYGGHGSSPTDDPGPACISFRPLRVIGPAHIKGSGGGFDFGNGVRKTAALATLEDPDNEWIYTLPAGYLNRICYFQVRPYASHVENLATYAPLRIKLDSGGEPVNTIDGTAELVAVEIRAGGIVRIKFLWLPAVTGIQPLQFLAIRTAGPTIPLNATITNPGKGNVSIDTPALLDSAPYTYKIQAKNGSTTKDLITGIVFTADATGPAVPTGGSASAW